MRYFLIPMQAPVNGTKGTKQDPWRPKYLKELGLNFSIRNARDVCLAEVSGDESAMDELAAENDVEEIPDDTDDLPPGRLVRIVARSGGLPLVVTRSGREVIASLKLAIQDKQIAARQQDVGNAVKDAIRG